MEYNKKGRQNHQRGKALPGKEGLTIYSYTYDASTGGLLLNSTPTGFSKEPRPVYAPELDVLGFDQYWQYDKQDALPYMWAEANCYYYRGTLVARLKGGNVYTAPEIVLPKDEAGNAILPEPGGAPLRPVDIAAMVNANRELLTIIEQTTVKKILAVYEKYKDKLDLFHVAFSGGKDSCVLLDLVKKALPHKRFVVIFGDTGMEFPDTYDVVAQTQRQCEADNIPFHIAKSHLEPEESWTLFGPPSRTLRWCCSVHKSAPQTLKLREITGKNDFSGLAFVGVRAYESATRAEYEYENYGKKIEGQYDHYPILEWSSAEVYLYAYTNNLVINNAYKKGNARAGCLVCPMSGGLGDYIRYVAYPKEIDKYFLIIRKTSDKIFTDSWYHDFIQNGAWKSRSDGRFVEGTRKRYSEECKEGNVHINITDPSSDWREWIKTLNWRIPISFHPAKNGYTIVVSEDDLKSNPSQTKILKQVLRKAAYCRACGVCTSNCRKGCIETIHDVIKIDNCSHCLACHNLPNGCLLSDSLKIPNGGAKVRSINSFTVHAPKNDWLVAFFDEKDAFFKENNLGPDQLLKFKVFLADSALSDNNSFSAFAEFIDAIGWQTDTALGLIMVNLVSENPQIRWYVDNLDIGFVYSRQNVIDMLLTYGLKERPAQSIAAAYKRIVDMPFGSVLHFGHVTEAGEIVRTKCTVNDARVVLYGLFKFAEKCNDYKAFTLATLLNDSIERAGVSPTRIFGLDRQDMVPLLLGLAARYPAFITASFTHDLEKITLAEDKSSQDVLDLLKEDAQHG